MATLRKMIADGSAALCFINEIANGPPRVCLCGSTRFAEEYICETRRLTLAGNIVLSVGLFGHQEGIDMEGPVKKMLDELHLRKIDLADFVFVINKDGYIGESTKKEIAYATAKEIPVYYMESTNTATSQLTG